MWNSIKLFVLIFFAVFTSATLAQRQNMNVHEENKQAKNSKITKDALLNILQVPDERAEVDSEGRPVKASFFLIEEIQMNNDEFLFVWGYSSPYFSGRNSEKKIKLFVSSVRKESGGGRKIDELEVSHYLKNMEFDDANFGTCVDFNSKGRKFVGDHGIYFFALRITCEVSGAGRAKYSSDLIFNLRDLKMREVFSAKNSSYRYVTGVGEGKEVKSTLATLVVGEKSFLNIEKITTYTERGKSNLVQRSKNSYVYANGLFETMTSKPEMGGAKEIAIFDASDF